MWMTAIAAGVLEPILSLIQFFTGNLDSSGTSVFIGVAMRLIIFAVMTFIIFQMREGKNWARIALAILLGGLGTLSLVIGPITWLFQGHTLSEAFDGVNFFDILFAISRIIHLACVISGLIFMFRTAANNYFRNLPSVL
jgi:hypothetical protein